ncbi:MAG: hypothetical protein WCI01_08255 [Chlorobiaceae bacterium]
MINFKTENITHNKQKTTNRNLFSGTTGLSSSLLKKLQRLLPPRTSSIATI